jgi:hypothetical protein
LWLPGKSEAGDGEASLRDNEEEDMPRKPDLTKFRLDENGQVVERWCAKHDEGRGAWVPADQFRPDPARVYGLSYICRACMSRLGLAYDHAHPEETNARKARYRERYPERVKASARLKEERRKAARRQRQQAESDPSSE